MRSGPERKLRVRGCLLYIALPPSKVTRLAGYCGSVATLWGWTPEAEPATCGPACADGHGAKLVPSTPYEPPHQAPTGACANAGTANATTANSATTPVHFIF